MANPNDRVFELVRQYRYNPRLFSEEQTDQLQEMANQFDIPFERKTEDFSLRNIFQNLSSGFMEGFTTIPVSSITGTEPKTTYESIAHSLGHLAGFAPGIMAAPLKIGSKGLQKVGMKTAASYVDEGALIAAKANHWSIPMMAGDKAKKATQWGLNKSKLETLDAFKKGASTKTILESAVHLGAASAMSSIWKGPDEMMNAGIYGAVAGGAFGGLGESKIIGNYLKSKNVRDFRKGEQYLKAAVGSSMMALPPALQNEPIEVIIYQTLLGGYFGYQGRPVHEVKGGKWISDLAYYKDKNLIFMPEKHPDWNTFSNKTQDYIKSELTRGSKNMMTRYYEGLGWDRDYADQQLTEYTKKHYNIPDGELPTKEQMDYSWRKKANEIYLTNPDTVTEKFTIRKDIADYIARVKQQQDSTDPVENPIPKKSTSKEKTQLDKNKEETSERQKVKKVYIVIQKSNGEIEHLGGIDAKKIGYEGDYLGKNNFEKYVNRPGSEIEKTEYITFDGIFIQDPKTGKFSKFKPLSFDLKSYDKGKTVELKRNLQEDVFNKIEVDLHESGRYIYGGVKAKGVFTVREYHKDTNRYKIDQIIDSLVDPRSDHITRDSLYKNYLDSWNRYKEQRPNMKRTKDAKEMHDKAWISNVLSTATRHGFYGNDLSQVYNIVRERGFARNVMDWNKREQLWQDRSMPLKPGTLGGRISFAIFNDVPGSRYTTNKNEKKRYDNDHDGTIYFEEGYIEKMQESLGLPPEVSMNKPVIVANIPGYGTLVVKAAGRDAPQEILNFMRKPENQLKSVIMLSAAKHTGNMKVHDFNRDLLEKGIYDLNPGDKLVPHFLEDSNIRINLGTFENPSKISSGTKIVKQLASTLNNYQAPGASEFMWSEVYMKSIEGDPTINTNVNKYLDNPTKSQYKQLKLKKVNPDDLSVETLERIFTKQGDSDLAKTLAKKIMNIDKADNSVDVESFTPEEYQQYVYQNNRVLRVSDASKSSREIDVNGSEFWERVYKNYVLKRYISPRYKYSAKTWMAPRHPHDVVINNIKAGEFKLDLGAGKMIVRYKGKDMTLEKAWKLSGQNNSDSAFDFLVIRVPSDSISGTRVLKFTGFTRKKGISITTNEKDNVYLGGADKDSDTTFIYQNMPKEIVSSFRGKNNKNQREWETDDGRLIEAKDSEFDTPEYFDTATDAKYSHPASQFSPSFRRDVAEVAAKGQDSIGFGVKGKENLLYMADYLAKNGQYTTELLSGPTSKKPGTRYATLTIKLKPNAHDILIRLGKEIVNRSADAANYSRMKDFSKWRDMLVNKAFEGEIRYESWMKQPPDKLTYNMLARSDIFKHITKSNSLINPNSTKNIFHFTREIEKLDTKILDTIPSMAARAISKIKKDKVFYKDNGTVPDDVATINRYLDILKTLKNEYVKIQEENPMVQRMNQLTLGKNQSFFKKFNPENMEKMMKNPNNNWSKIVELTKKDMNALASWYALTKQGSIIMRSLEKMPFKKGVVERDAIDKWLVKMAKEATAIKKRHIDNSGTNNKGPKNFTLGEYDIAVKRFHSMLDNKYNQLQKQFGDKNLITPDMMKDYFDLYLLSPFYYGSTKTSYSKIPYQSQPIREKAIKKLLDAQEELYTSGTERVDSDKPLKSLKDLGDQSVPKHITHIRHRVYKDDTHYLRTRATDDKQYKEVLDFEKTLDNNKFIKDNLRDFYENFVEEYGMTQVRKDFELITIEDIVAMNKFIKDMDMRFKPIGDKLPDFAWRASPEYMDLFMKNFEEKFFIKSQQPVKTRDGFVMREVKKYTSTIGVLRDYMSKIVAKMDSDANLVSTYNQERYGHRGLSKSDAEAINIITVAKREGLDYRSLKEYTDRINKKFEIRGETYDLDTIIAKTDATMTKDYTEFGKTHIYSRDDKGNYLSPSDVVEIIATEIDKLVPTEIGSPTTQKSGVTHYPEAYKGLSGKFELLKQIIKDTGKEIWGKTTAWYGPVGYDYSKSAKHDAQEMPPEFQKIARSLEITLGLKEGYFNSALVNIMPKGSKLGRHQDNEPIFHRKDKTVGKVATISLGSKTDISIKKGYNKKTPEEVITVGDGDLYVMPGKKFQTTHTHAVRTTTGERISLTFRHVPKNQIPKTTGSKNKGRWREIDELNQYGRLNKFLKWNSDGKFDMKSFTELVIKSVEQGGKIPEIQLETILRAHYELRLERMIHKFSRETNTKLSMKELRENYRKGKQLDPAAINIQNSTKASVKGMKFKPIGRFDARTYNPHVNFGRNKSTQKQIDKHIEDRLAKLESEAKAEGLSKSDVKNRVELERLKLRYNMDKSKSTDGGKATSAIESVMLDFNKMSLRDIKNLGLDFRPDAVRQRLEDMPGWDNTEFAVDIYKEQVIRAIYKNVMALQASIRINEFQNRMEREKGIEFAENWALYLRTYFRDSMGLPTVFGHDLAKYIRADEKFESRLYYKFSDEKVIKAMNQIDKRFRMLGRRAPFMSDIPPKPDPKLYNSMKTRELYEVQLRAHMEAMTRAIHNFGRAEAKFQLITLLAHPKLYVGNMFGGQSNTITRGGLKNLTRSNSKSFLMKNIIKDASGNFRLKFRNGSEVKNVKDLNRWIGEQGIIESFISNELNLNLELSTIKGRSRVNLMDFMKEVKAKIKKDPNVSDDTLWDIAKKYQVDKKIEKSAAWFMQSSERKLRRDAFLTHAIEYMEHFGKDGFKMNLSDPAVMEAGLRGVEATQYIYHSSSRPAYMRTSLGKVLSRFKLFVFNSVRIRKEMLRKAKYYGYKEGTKEFDKFKTDYAIMLFTMALGSAFQYSLFDTALPPPYDWVQETSDWLFGDKDARDKAFFGQYPYPIAPLNIITPPVARIPIEGFSSLINKDWERFMDYQVYTMFPFGRMIRSFDKTIDEPYGTAEGRAMQQFFGIPLDKIRSKVDRANILELRKQKIDKELGELYE